MIIRILAISLYIFSLINPGLSTLQLSSLSSEDLNTDNQSFIQSLMKDLLFPGLTWNEIEGEIFMDFMTDANLNIAGIGFRSSSFDGKPSKELFDFYYINHMKLLGWHYVGFKDESLLMNTQYYNPKLDRGLDVKIGKCHQLEETSVHTDQFCVQLWVSSSEINPKPVTRDLEEVEIPLNLPLEYQNPLVVPFFSQRGSDPNNNIILGYGTCTTTLHNYGCVVTSYAMIYNYYQANFTNPVQLNDSLKVEPGVYSLNQSGCYNYWPNYVNLPDAPSGVSGSPRVYNACTSVNCIDPSNITLIDSELSQGHPIHARVHWSGVPANYHSIVIIGHSGSNYYINDPWALDSSIRTLTTGAAGQYVVDYLIPTHGTPPGGGVPLPSDTTWCANEGGRCNFSGTGIVYYGANNSYYFKENVSNGIDCNNNVFGDPISGVQKACYYKITTPPTSCPTLTGEVRLYDLVNCGGDSATANSTGLWSMASSFNDRAESIAIPSGWSARLYQNDNENLNESACFGSTDSNLNDNTYANGGNVGNSATWMRVYANSNCTGTISPPPAPTLNNPGNGSSHPYSYNLNFQWNASSGASEYLLEWWGGPYNPMQPCGWSNSTSCSIGTVASGYTYSWKVKARNSAGESSWSDTWTFTIQPQPPQNFNKVSPENNMVVSDFNPTLSWETSSGADSYEYCLYISGNARCNDNSWIAVGNVTSIQLSNLIPNTIYNWQVRARNAAGTTESTSYGHYWTFTTPGTCPQQFTGWKGEYWNNVNLSGNAVLCRDDFDLDFPWGMGSPAPIISVDNFSARWTRTLTFQQGTYRFWIDHDDGARIYIDDMVTPRLDVWESCCSWNSVEVPLTAGDHTIRVEMHEDGGAANIKFYWEPTTILGWRGEYFNNDSWAGNPSLVRDDPEIDFEWYAGSPSPLIKTDYFSARWTRTWWFDEGVYQFEIYHDDGAWLEIDGNLVYEDPCVINCIVTDYVDVPLTGGWHTLVMRLRENSGYTGVRLSWLLPIEPDSYEPDDSFEQAKAIAPGEIQIHNITPAYDTDWATFTLTQTSLVTLITSGDTSDNTRMWLYDNNLTEIEFNDDDGVGNYALIDRTCGSDPLLPGKYFIKIDESGNDHQIQSYALTFNAQDCYPTRPTLISPAHMASLPSSQPVEFTWSPVSGATGYYVQYWNSANVYRNSGWILSTQWSSTLPSDTYGWRVKVRNGFGLETWSNNRIFTLQNPPQPTTLLSPANNTVLPSTLPVNFSWSAVNGATAYYVQYWNSANVYRNSGWISDTQWSNTIPAGNYGWRVKVRDQFGQETWSNNRIFTLQAAPLPPTLLNPAKGVVLPSILPVNFSWSTVNGATAYYVQYWNSANIYRNSGWITSTEWSITLPVDTYGWRVKVRDALGQETWSANSNFNVQVIPPPIPPPLITPINGTNLSATQPVSFSWSPVNGAVAYYVQYWNSANIYRNSGWITATDWSISLTPDSYGWRVKARDAYGQETWSVNRRFNVRNPPPPVILINPVNGATISSSQPVNFTWSAYSEASAYYVQYWTSSGIYRNSGWVTANNWSSLLDSGSYGWRVKVRDIYGLETWSSNRTFNIVNSSQPVQIRD